MARLTLLFLGSFQAFLDGKPLAQLRSARIQGLLAYLALESAHAHTREALATLFWPDEQEQVARQNVRQAIYQLRQILGEQDVAFLIVTRETVQFNPTSDHTLDVATLLKYLKSGQIQEAIELYRGELLAQFTSGSDRFEEWLLLRREQLHILIMDALHRLTEAALAHNTYTEAQHYARRQLALEPWREHAHRQLMLALAQSGDRSAALAQYEACRRALAQELGVEPEDETNTLVEAIRSGGRDKLIRWGGDTATSSSPRLLASSRRNDWGNAPDGVVMYGRERELEQMSNWFNDDHCRLIAILGMGGMGKTTLAAQLARQSAEQFTHVVWRSLLNAPKLSELLSDWLHVLVDQQITHVPTRLDAQLDLLFEQLREQHCLLVLDNVETIMGGDERAGSYRVGYEEYGQLLLRIGQSQHQSCLLLTSREQPREFARLATPRIRILSLVGLNTAVGSDLLIERGLTGSRDSMVALVERYSGNPLALKLVAEAINDLFAGDIDAFMRNETLIFDDIRDVLDQQFSRLAPLERTMLLWMAVAREPVSEEELWQLLARTSAKRPVLESLRSLLRRSLVEQHAGTCSLQHVVTEYLTDYLVNQVCYEFEAEAPDVLYSHALLATAAKEYVRQSQQRVILQPISKRLLHMYGRIKMEACCKRLLETERHERPLHPNFLAGNLLNLLVEAGIDLRGYDFSNLCVWQAYMRGIDLPEANFAHADLAGSVFTDYVGAVTSVAISPDGTLLATGADNGVISLWHLADRQLVGIYQGHRSHIWSLAWSHDGQHLVSASDDATARIWNVATRQPTHILAAHTSGVAYVAVHPDNTLVASSSTDHAVCIWDMQTGQLLRTLRGHSAMIPAVAWSLDGTLLASASHDHTVQLWDWRRERVVHTLRHHSGPVVALAFSRYAITWGESERLLLITGSHDQTIGVWDAQTYALLGSLTGHSAPIVSLVLSADGSTLMSGSDDQTIRVWDLPSSGRMTSGQAVRVLRGHYGVVVALAAHTYASDGQTLLVSSSYDKTVRLWDTRSGQALAILQGHSKWLQAIVFAADNRLFVGGSDGQRVRVWDGHTGRALHSFHGHTSLTEKLSFRTDGIQLASAGWDGTVRIWDLRRAQALHVLQSDVTPVVAAVIGPGPHERNVVASGSLDHAIRIWDAVTGTLHATWHGHRDRVVSFAFRPDGAQLASGSWDHTIGLWNISSGELVRLLEGHTSPIECVAFHPNGKMLASGSWDGSVRVWDAQTGETLHTLSEHNNGLEMVAFSPDGTLMASCACDHLVCIWDVQSGQLMHRLEGHTSWVRCIAWSQDGTLLASGSDDGTIRLWDVAPSGAGACRQTVVMEAPYTGMHINNATGISQAQWLALKMLGAVEMV